MSLIIWAPTHEGLMVSSDLDNIFHLKTMLLAVSDDHPEFAAKMAAYLDKHEVDLASELHVEALRTVVRDYAGQAEITVSFGQHNHGLSGIVLMTVENGQLSGFETREYKDDSETEYIPLGADAAQFLSKVAQHPNYLKTLRQKKIQLVQDLTLETARKISREMIRDTYLSGNKKPPEPRALEVRPPH